MSYDTSEEELVIKLPEIAFCGDIPFGKYFRMETSKGSTWQFYNAKPRKWQYLTIYDVKCGPFDYSVILREGWIVRKLEPDGRHYYYKCEDGRVSNVMKEEALQIACAYCPGLATVQVLAKGEYLYLKLQPIYLPVSYYKALASLSIPIADESLAREGLFCFKKHKLPLLRQLLSKVRIRFEVRSQLIKDAAEEEQIEAEQTFDIRTTISEILTLAYSDYLKKEVNIEKFLQHILNKEWNSVRDEQLRKRLEELSERSEKDGHVSSSIFDFLVKSASYVDWKFYHNFELSSKIKGVVVDTYSLTYGETWSRNYYKIVFPVFESVLYWPTTIAPTYRGIGKVSSLQTRLKTVELSEWRIYPYLGRLRKVGSSSDVNFVESSGESLHDAFLAIIGIPTFEKILSDRAYLGGFNVDLESWRGVYNLSRYFVGIVRIIEPLMLDGITPITKIQDIFGNFFAVKWDLDTYFHCIDDIHKIEHAGWISILLKNEFQNLKHTDEVISIFETVPRIKHRFVKKRDALQLNLAAVTKYCSFLPKDLLIQIAQRFIIDHDFDELLEACIGKNWLYEDNKKIYYFYRGLDKASMEKLIMLLTDTSKFAPEEVLRTRWYMTWSIVRAHLGLTHPLIYAEAVFPEKKLELPESDADKYKALEEILREVVSFHSKDRKTRRVSRISALIGSKDPKLSYHSTYIGNKDIDVYVRDATLMLCNYGVASIEAMGRWVAKAHTVATYLTRKFAYLEPKVVRSDSMITRNNGKRVRTVKFEVQSYSI